MKAIVHCQGSTSFCMSAVAGLVPEVDVIVSNAVSLHPVIPAFARFKIQALRPAMQQLTPYLNPAWGDGPTTAFSRWREVVVLATHRECANPVCRMVSFTYGSAGRLCGRTRTSMRRPTTGSAASSAWYR